MKLVLISLFVLILALTACSDDTGKSPASSSINCTSYDLRSCPEECVVCPPCEVCSSLKCDYPSECEKRGFDKNWTDGFRRH